MNALDQEAQEEFSWTVLPLKLGRIGCAETSATKYNSALSKIPEERTPILNFIKLCNI
jgi:hypothetical protein